MLACAGCSFVVEGFPIADTDGAARDGAVVLDLAGADFAGADFANADLANVDLATADLTPVDFAPPADLKPPRDLATPIDLLPPPPDLAGTYCGAANVVACYQFEDGAASTTAIDGSPNHNDLTLSGGAAEVAGGHSGGALSVGASGLAHVAHNASFDVASVTIEAWIKMNSLPSGTARMGIADEDGQYGLFLVNNGSLRCSANAAVSTANNTITTGTWIHVACTNDGATLRVFINGVQKASTASGALPTNQPNGLSVGSNSPNGDNLDGLIDDARILSVARTQREVCADYGGGGC